MKNTRTPLRALSVFAFLIALTGAAHAQATRTWVSGVGDDANPCSRTAPCKTYAGAISKTARDGEISTLDPGGFGAVTLTKSITINGGGTGQGYGSILAALTNGVIINITDPADTRKTVRLNWLDINGASTGVNAIRVLSATNVFVENTNIDGFTNHGIDVNLAVGNTTGVSLMVKHTSIRNCTQNGIGITNAGSGQVVATISDSKIQKCSNGISTGVHSRLLVTRSEITHNTNGINNAAADSIVNAESVYLAFHGGAGIVTSGGADRITRISRCAITQNATGLSVSGGGQVESAGNNFNFGNSSNGAPTSTPGQT